MEVQKTYYTAEDVSKALGISKPTAYVIIRKMNKELDKMGKLTIRGKVNAKYFLSQLEV